MNRKHLATLILALGLFSLINATPAEKRPASNYLETSKSETNNNANALKAWKAGTKVTAAAIKEYGIDNCFAVSEINKSILHRIQGKSYKTGCTIPLADLRYLKVLHYNKEGEICLGEMICHKDISADLIDIFRRLYSAHYPIARMVLVDEYGADDERSMTDNNTTCFNYRTVANSRTLSNHSKGRAVDINPLYNPHVKKLRNGTVRTSPAAGKPYTDRSRTFDYKIDTNDLCYKEFIKHGFRWGGNWKHSKDYQHFEKP